MLKHLFVRSKPVEKQKIIIVSGLPRSGTSMMMKMLGEGGLPIFTDEERQADEDNPNGYFELEASKKLKGGDVRWIYETQGKVVKVISYLLEFLPDEFDYDVVFMEREIQEILASQKKMLQRRNEANAISDEDMESQFHEHLKALKYWIARKPNMRVLYVKYSEMVDSADKLCPFLAEFLERPLNVEAMSAVPNQALYRNRSS